MKEEFIHEFIGFHGTQSRCHIRILNAADKPLVIMCSQMAEKPGTSVTNMAEYIAIDIRTYLQRDNLTLSSAIAHYLQTKKLSEMLSDLITGLKKSNKYTLFALESLKLALEYHERHKSTINKVKEFIWVELYPADVGLNSNGSYDVVEFESETWQPNWQSSSVESIAKDTGYPSKYFSSPDEAIRKA